MNYYLHVLQNFATFSGRARRSEYWMFTLFNLIVYAALFAVDMLAGTMVIAMIYSLATFIPGLAVAVRRLHDTGKSGWWLLIAFVPVLGAIALLVFMCQDSYPSDNQYGPNPKLAPAYA